MIDGHIRFAVQPASDTDSDRSDAMAFTWLDMGGEEDSYLFVIEGVSKEDIVKFEMIAYRCMWERDNNRDAKDATNEELLAYRYAESSRAK